MLLRFGVTVTTMAEEGNYGNSGGVKEEMDTRQLYIYLCINICPVLNHQRLSRSRPATNATCTMSSFVSPAGALMRKAIDSHRLDHFYMYNRNVNMKGDSG